jgi:hypothetical protein
MLLRGHFGIRPPFFPVWVTLPGASSDERLSDEESRQRFVGTRMLKVRSTSAQPRAETGSRTMGQRWAMTTLRPRDGCGPKFRPWLVRVRSKETAATVGVLCQSSLNVITSVEADRVDCVDGEPRSSLSGTICSATRSQCSSPRAPITIANGEGFRRWEWEVRRRFHLAVHSLATMCLPCGVRAIRDDHDTQIRFERGSRGGDHQTVGRGLDRQGEGEAHQGRHGRRWTSDGPMECPPIGTRWSVLTIAVPGPFRRERALPAAQMLLVPSSVNEHEDE